MEKEGVRSSWNYSYHDEIDPSLEYFYQPRNISILVISILALVYVAIFKLEDDQIFNLKFGLWAAVGVLIVTGMLQFKDGPFIRPHPAFWRIVLALSVAYQMCLVVLLLQHKDSARHIMKFIDPKLGIKLPEKNYGDSCELNFENVMSQLDIFVVAHTIGWIAKALIFRDYWLCWIISVLFEIMEYTFEHQLPNFGECWWDHWILDVLTSNWLGIYLGMKLCEYFELKVYSFRGFHEIKSYKGKIARGVQQFGPHSWTKFEWGTGKSLYRFVGILGILTLEIICELNAFYLKTLLWIPIESRLNVWRLVFYFFTTMPAVREAYQYLSDAKCKRLGFHAWMCTANILTELIIIIKFSKGEFPNQIPGNVIWFWISTITIIIMYAIWKFKIDFIKKHQ